ncbi:MAG: 6-bladed beta-propeller [Bacteroidota bacterium]|nr:6-bladed beta-propeller [Bacteroidota bacterium]MDE2644230.1 6-bladed beta-propeller [Bacteroidota bacterium]
MPQNKFYQLGFILTVSNCSTCENAPSNDFPNSAERIELNESFRIGDESRGDTLLFGQVNGIALNSTNQFLVWDDVSKVIHVFSKNGDLIRTFGREGEGPGEFSSVRGLHIGPRDSIFVGDSRDNSLSVFEPQRHQFVYKISVSDTDDEGTCSPTSLIALENNLFIIRYSPFYSRSMETGEPLMYASIHHIDRQGRIVGEPLLRLPETRYLMTASATGISVMILPYSRDSFIRSGPGGLLYSGWNDSINVAIHTSEGDFVGRIRYPHQPIPVTEAMLNERMQYMSTSQKSRLLEAGIPETKPAYSTFSVDDQGRIWVKHTQTNETTALWTVLNSDSEPVYEVGLPLRVNLRVIKGNRRSQDPLPA